MNVNFTPEQGKACLEIENAELRKENQRLKNIIYTTLEYVDREEVSSVGTPFTSTSIGKEIKELLEGEKTFNSIWKENQILKERIEYLERSNNRREDTIMSLRDEIIDQKDYESVLNELEKWLKEQRDYYFENYYYSDFNAYGSKLDDVLDKLKELKESDK